RRFGGDRIKGIMNWAGFKEDEALENSMVSKAMEGAQVKVEAHNFEIRKYLVEYDDVVNRHRDVIYGERGKLISGADLKANVQDMVERELQETLTTRLAGRDAEEWDVPGLVAELRTMFPLSQELQADRLEAMSREEITEAVLEYARKLYAEREQALGVENMRTVERLVMLRVIDSHWVVHLTAMEALRQGIGLQAAGQRDPLVAYRTEAHASFQQLTKNIQQDIARTIYHASMAMQQPAPAPQGGARQPRASGRPAQPARPASRQQSPMAAVTGNRGAQPAQVGAKVGRNEPCPCGSGKKYKRCHGAAA
ncbi:MAG: preprotein translocase subunit SecA, partial [SAR202 cluster bacterium]|nr:preprotein translocase subunit SecA [SAR202 cluster bacterium]